MRQKSDSDYEAALTSALRHYYTDIPAGEHRRRYLNAVLDDMSRIAASISAAAIGRIVVKPDGNPRGLVIELMTGDCGPMTTLGRDSKYLIITGLSILAAHRGLKFANINFMADRVAFLLNEGRVEEAMAEVTEAMSAYFGEYPYLAALEALLPLINPDAICD